MKSFFVLALTCIFFLPARAQYVSLDNAEIKALKRLVNSSNDARNLYQNLKATADAALNETPNPIDSLSSEGKLKGAPKLSRTLIAMADMDKIYALAVAYKTEGRKDYLDKVVVYLMMWANTNQPGGNPINDSHIDRAIEGFDLVKNDLSDMNRRWITDWLFRVADAEIKNPRMRPGTNISVNNWNSHRLKIVGLAGLATNNTTLIKWTLQELKKHIAVNLMPDGSSLDFKMRDALSYHAYDLDPLLKLSRAIKRASGEDFYNYTSPTQSSIKKSVDWFIPYVNGSQEHAEFVNTKAKFDVARSKNNEPGHRVGEIYDPKRGLPVLSLASYFDKTLLKVLQARRNGAPAYYDWQLVLNNIMK